MTKSSKTPEMTFSTGAKGDFNIGVVLPAVESNKMWSDDDANSVLFLTEGYMTFFVQSVNVLAVVGKDDPYGLDKSYSRLSLSMLLEWIVFDKSYLPSGGTASFADLIAGESSPPISFTLRDRVVQIEWNFNDSKRSNLSYSTPVGEGQIQYGDYLNTLCAAVDKLVAGIERRAKDLALQSQWQLWWSGYTAENKGFHDFVHKWSN